MLAKPNGGHNLITGSGATATPPYPRKGKLIIGRRSSGSRERIELERCCVNALDDTAFSASSESTANGISSQTGANGHPDLHGPRRKDDPGSLSEKIVSFKNILAGCSVAPSVILAASQRPVQ
eukprot:4259657-Pyramimonas_sp.AAC.1